MIDLKRMELLREIAGRDFGAFAVVREMLLRVRF
jgi:hypothetical protein